MKPVTVEIEVPQRREEVFDFLDVLGNHEEFTDHLLVHWSLDGPQRGVGARARMFVKGPRLTEDQLDMEVVEAKRPVSTTEESVSASGHRRTRGTYLLEDIPAYGTRISFRFEWLEAPLIERLAAPLTRSVVRRANERSLQRLAETLGSNGNGKERS
jgi:Polyketide cyclase / dehydrase and lipid transport